MHGGRVTVFVLWSMLFIGGACSAVAQETMHPVGIKGGFISKPMMIKQLYRMAWEQDNNAQMSLIDQIEYFQEHNPGFDEATLAVMRRGTEMMRKMDLGLNNKDLSEKAKQIRQSPAVALDDFLVSDKEDNLETKDALAATDIMDAAEKLEEKIYQNKSLNRTIYQIDIDAF